MYKSNFTFTQRKVTTTVEVDYTNVNHSKRQISEPTFSSLKFLVQSFLKKNTVYSETVTKPAEIARQAAKSLLKEVEILLLKGIRNPRR